MADEAGFARCCVASWLFDRRLGPLSPTMAEIEFAVRFVPDAVVLLAKDDAVLDMIGLLVDRTVFFERALAGDISVPIAVSETIN